VGLNLIICEKVLAGLNLIFTVGQFALSCRPICIVGLGNVKSDQLSFVIVDCQVLGQFALPG